MSLFRKSPTGESTGAPPAGTTAAGEPVLEPLTSAEVDWVRSSIAELADQDVRLGDIDDLGRHYDEMLNAWVRLTEAQRPDPQAIVTRVGLAFGQYVADQARLEWAVATDEHGTEIALHGERGSVLIYPIHLVSGHWAAHDRNVLPALARQMIATVEEIH